MPDDAVTYEVRSLQAEFLKRLYRQSKQVPATSPPQLLRKLVDIDAQTLQYALGDYGKVLVNLTQSIDLEHPDIFSFFDGFFCDDNLFAQRCLELLELAKLAKSQNFTSIFPLLGKMLVEESLEKSILKRLDVTSQYKFHVRLVKDRSLREDIRKTKKMQTIDLQALYKKGEEIWNSQPSDFRRFLRFDAAYTAELKQAQKKMRRYEELGCSALATEIQKSIASFRENMDQSYHGFNRITMTNIAIILAKSLGYIFRNTKNSDNSEYIARVDPTIVIPKSFFGDYCFDPTVTPEFISVTPSTVFVLSKPEFYVYEPRVYPFHELQEIAPKSVLDLINYLENFPDVSGKPIFDHFGVIVPGISYNYHHFVNTEGTLETYNCNEDCCKAMDKNFIKNKYFYPIIVGEKDGKCFFVSYWA